jgi:hypothetical protein
MDEEREEKKKKKSIQYHIHLDDECYHILVYSQNSESKSHEHENRSITATYLTQFSLPLNISCHVMSRHVQSNQSLSHPNQPTLYLNSFKIEAEESSYTAQAADRVSS